MKKTVLLSLALCLFTTSFLFAQAPNVSFENVVIEKPDQVSIKTVGDTMIVAVQGKEGNPDFNYVRQAVLAPDEVVVTKERRADLDFHIPLMKSKKVRKNKNKIIMRGLGVGLVSALNAPKGMNVDMSGSFEFMGPTLEWAYYPGASSTNLSIGVGVNWKNYRMTGKTRFIKENGDLVLGSYPEGAKPDFSRIKVFSWTLPLFVNFSLDKNWHMTVGPVVNFNTYASLKTYYSLEGKSVKELDKDLRQTPITVDVMAVLNFRGIGVYAKYSPCKVMNTAYAPDFRGLSAGLTLWW